MAVNVLVTGAAGNLARFIYKARMCLDLAVNVVGCNYSHDGMRLYQFDTGYVVPPANDLRFSEINLHDGIPTS